MEKSHCVCAFYTVFPIPWKTQEAYQHPDLGSALWPSVWFSLMLSVSPVAVADMPLGAGLQPSVPG